MKIQLSDWLQQGVRIADVFLVKHCLLYNAWSSWKLILELPGIRSYTWFRLHIVLNVRKHDLSHTAFREIAFETVIFLFSPDGWLHIYTDETVGNFTSHFTGELEAIRETSPT